jgi:hypothetical protein
MIDIDGALILRSPLDGFRTFPSIGALALTFTLAMLTSAILTRSTARFARTARERVHLQAWQVRQLVPDRRRCCRGWSRGCGGNSDHYIRRLGSCSRVLEFAAGPRRGRGEP